MILKMPRESEAFFYAPGIECYSFLYSVIGVSESEYAYSAISLLLHCCRATGERCAGCENVVYEQNVLPLYRLGAC